MKLFTILVFVILFLSQPALAGGPKVPGVGSVWERTITHHSVVEDGSSPRKKSEIVKVERMQDGRPVFVGKIFGNEGEIIESSVGTIVYAHECKNDVPKEMLAPPIAPNQCVWHVCYAPPVGQTFSRKMIIFAPMFACQPQAAIYTFTSVRVGTYGNDVITIGKAVLTLVGVTLGHWESYIKAGEGEIFSESPGKVTTYDRVIVNLVPYQIDRELVGVAPFR